MKKSLLLFLVSVFIGGTAVAQTDNTLQFVDKNGNVVADGATVNGELEYVDGGSPEWSYWQVSTGLWIKNSTDEHLGASLQGEVTRIDNGQFSCCFPKECKAPMHSTGTYTSDPSYVRPGEQADVSIHWEPTEYGQCTATIKMLVYDVTLNDWGIAQSYTYKADGPTVTVNFIYSDPAGINGVTIEGENEIVARYSLDGRKLSEPQTGINVVKYANGKIAKVFVK